MALSATISNYIFSALGLPPVIHRLGGKFIAPYTTDIHRKEVDMHHRTHKLIFGGVKKSIRAVAEKGFVLAIIFVLLLGVTGALHAQCRPRQINAPGETTGWEYPNTNTYAWAMTKYTTAAGSFLYVGTNNQAGGQIWRKNITLDLPWEKVLDTAAQPLGNMGFRNIVEFNGEIYAGTRQDFFGCQLWRSTNNGTAFERVVGLGGAITSGFGDPDYQSVRGMEVFGDDLYIGLKAYDDSGKPAQIWRTDGVTFEPVVSDGFGDAGNDSARTMAVREGKLYVSTRNRTEGTGGLQIWTTTDGSNYNCLVGPGGSLASSGFGDPEEDTPLHLYVHKYKDPADGIIKDYLFLGVSRRGGFNVYRIAPGDTGWTKVASNGLGERFAWYAWRFESFGDVGDGSGDYLWMGTFNYYPLTQEDYRTGAALYRSPDNGVTWEKMVGGNRLYPPPDSPALGKCFDFGFNHQQNFGFRSFAVVEDQLFIGTGACPNECPFYEGTEIWVWPCADCQPGNCVDLDFDGDVDGGDLSEQAAASSDPGPNLTIFSDSYGRVDCMF
jgi:hypothetical protein